MAMIMTNSSNYTNIAEAIREKTGTTEKWKPAEMPDAIAAITPNLQDKTADSFTAPYARAQTISPDEGYDGLSSVTLNALVAQTKTATPTTSSQTVKADSGKVLTSVTVEKIPTEYVNTNDATAGAGDILTGKTAYAKGTMVSGTLTIQNYYTGSGEPSSSLGSNGDLYLKVVE